MTDQEAWVRFAAAAAATMADWQLEDVGARKCAVFADYLLEEMKRRGMDPAPEPTWEDLHLHGMEG